MRSCSKPNCARSSTALLAFDYGARRVMLEDLPQARPSPHHYALCPVCADRLSPPRGWFVEDRRTRPEAAPEVVLVGD